MAITKKSTQEIANIARYLAGYLQDFAYTRKDEDKKQVNRLQVELVQAVKKEQDGPDL